MESISGAARGLTFPADRLLPYPFALYHAEFITVVRDQLYNECLSRDSCTHVRMHACMHASRRESVGRFSRHHARGEIGIGPVRRGDEATRQVRRNDEAMRQVRRTGARGRCTGAARGCTCVCEQKNSLAARVFKALLPRCVSHVLLASRGPRRLRKNAYAQRNVSHVHRDSDYD